MRIAILVMFAVLSFVSAFAQDKPKNDPPPNSKPLTALGQMAFRALAPEIEKVQADLQVFRESELKAQNLDPKEWDIKFDLTPGKEQAVVVRISPAAPELPAKPEEPPKKPESGKQASPTQGRK